MIHVLGQKTIPTVAEADRDTHEMTRTDLAILTLVNLGFGLAIIVRGLWPHGG